MADHLADLSVQHHGDAEVLGHDAPGRAGGQTEAERALAELIVLSLQLEIAAAEVEPEMRLFGEGLGLDSIDALELALAISRTYGFDLRSDDERNRQVFATLRSLSAHVEANRAR